MFKKYKLQIEKLVPKNQNEVVFFGDFNALSNKDDSSSLKKLDNDQRLIIYKNIAEKLLIPWNLSDIAKETNATHYTHFDVKTNTSSRIDFIFSNRAEEYQICKVNKNIISDHSPLMVSETNDNMRGQSYRKMNDVIFHPNSIFLCGGMA